MGLELTVESGSMSGHRIRPDDGAVVLGRDESCAVRFLDERLVSRRHAEVRAEGGRLFVRDLGSRNGTFVNGRRVSTAELRPGDTLRLGAEGPVLRVVSDEASLVEPLLLLDEAAPEEPATSASRPSLPSFAAHASMPRRPVLDSGQYDPTRDKGRRYSPLSLVVVFGMMGMGAFLGLLVGLLTAFSLGLGAALIGVTVAFMPAPLYLAVWLWLDRNDPEPAWILAGALAWGAGAATFVSGLVNDLFEASVAAVTHHSGLASFLSASLSAPLIEEAMKGVAVMLIFFFMRREFDGVLDGIAYAGVVALGFATVENVLYYGRAVAKEGFGALLVVFVLRGVLGPFTHAVYTAMTGIGFGIARETHKPALRALAPLVGFGLAAFLHFLWNTLAALAGAAFFLIYLVFWAPLFLAFFLVVGWMGHRESRLIRRMLDGEVEGGLITRDQADLVASWPRRIGWLVSAIGQSTRLRARRRFLAATTRLALCNWHVARAQAAGGATVSFAQIPSLFSEIQAVRGQV
jgi:protease PrsW